MRTFDFSPLFRSSVGFDRMQRLLDTAMRLDEQAVSYPPYNIESVDENAYRITMAVAGFSADEIDVTVAENSLIVTGKHASDEGERHYLHRGIAARSFERRFELADTIKVKGADLENGLLNVELVREVPEEAKPKKIAIATGAPKSAERKAA